MSAEERRRQRAGKVIIGAPRRFERVPASRSRWLGNTVLRLNPAVSRRQIISVLFLLAALGGGITLLFLLFELVGIRFCDWDGCLAAVMRSLALKD